MSNDSPQPPTPPSPPPPPGGAPIDSRLERFMAKAQPIIAMERGINARSRVLLEAAARDMKLPDELFDQAIHMLQGAPPVNKKKNDHWIEAFDKYLEPKIKDAPQGIVTAEIEARCVQRGMKKFDLTEDQARDTVREVAERLGLHRITLSEAERHVADMIEQKVGDAAWLDDKTVVRLRAAGTGWGLTADQVDALIRQHTANNRDRQEREQRTNMIMLTGAGVVVLIGICVFVAVVLFGTGGTPTDTDVANNPDVTTDPDDPAPPPVVPVKPPEWWTHDLLGNVMRLRTTKVIQFQEIYQQIASPNAEERISGYNELMRVTAKDWEDVRLAPRIPQSIGNVFADCYLLEPDDGAADALREKIISTFHMGKDGLSKDPLYFDRAFWGLGVSLDTLQGEELADNRATVLEGDIGRTIGDSVTRASETDTLFNKGRAALARQYYSTLAQAIDKQSLVAADLHKNLKDYVTRHKTTFPALFDGDEINRLETDFVVPMLEKTPNQFTRYRASIRDLVQQGEPLIVARFIELMEKSKSEPIQAEVAWWLINRFDIPKNDVATPKSTASSTGPLSISDVTFDVPKIATFVRAELGIKAPVAVATAADRWKNLKDKIDDPLARLRLPDRNDEDYLKRIVEVSHYATLACAVAQQEPGFAIFDKLLEDGPPGTKKKDDDDDDPFGTKPIDEPSTPTSTEPTRRQLENVNQYVDPLERYETKLETQKSFERLSFIRGLRNLANDGVPDISPLQAETIARYLVGPKEGPEHVKLMEYIQPMSKWNNMVLALADVILTRVNDRAPAEALLQSFLGHELELDDARWQLSIYEQLIQIVHNRIAERTVVSDSSDPHQGYISAAAGLHELYKKRAEVLGMAPGSLVATESAADVLRVLIDRDGARMAGGSTKSPDGKFLAQLPHQLRAIDYLGTNDLRKTVLLQRIRVRMLSITVKRRHSDRSSEAEKLMDDLARFDSKATSVIEQLAQGEATSLKLWLLFAPK